MITSVQLLLVDFNSMLLLFHNPNFKNDSLVTLRLVKDYLGCPEINLFRSLFSAFLFIFHLIMCWDYICETFIIHPVGH